MGQFIFDLVKSLSKGEAGAVTKRASRASKTQHPQHILLFQAYASLKSYDKTSLLKKLDWEPSEKHLHVIDNYLANSILQTLSEIDGGEVAEIKRQINYVGILVQRSLAKEARKRVKALKKRVQRSELFSLWQQLLELELTLAKLKPNLDWMQDVYQQMDELLAIQQNAFIYKKAQEQLEVFFWKGKETGSNKEAIDKLFLHPNLLDETRAISSTAKFTFHHIWAGYSYINGDEEKSFIHLQKAADSLSSSGPFLKVNIESYIRISFNICMFYSGRGDLIGLSETFERISDNVNSLTGNQEHHKAIIKVRRAYYILECLSKTKSFDKALKFADNEINLEDEDWQDFDYYRMLVFLRVAYIQLWRGEYKQALKSLNMIQVNVGEGMRDDLWVYSKLLICLTRIEQLQYDGFEIASKDLDVLAERLNFESEIVNLFIGLSKTLSEQPLDEKAAEAFYKRFLNAIQGTSLNFTDNEFLKDYDLISWLKNRIS